MSADVRQESPQALNTGSVTTQTSTAFGSACVVGNTIVAWVESPGVTPTSVVDSASQTYSLKATVSDATNGQVTLLYVLQNNTSTANLTVSANFSSSTAFIGVWTAELEGVATASYQTSVGPAPQVNPGTSANAITSGNITPTSAPALLYALTVRTGGAITAPSTQGSGFTAGTTGFTASGVAVGCSEWKRVTSTTAIPATFTNATDGAAATFCTIVASFTEASAGTTLPVGSLLM